MTTLKLTLTKYWFDLIASGIKTEEYREIKPYWISRLNEKHTKAFKPFTLIQFTNGYTKDSPRITMECLGITICKTTVKGAGYATLNTTSYVNEYFVIKIGKEISRKNC